MIKKFVSFKSVPKRIKMFSKPKTKPLLPPSYEETHLGNSNKRFKRNLNGSTLDLCNRSFDTAQSLLHKTDNLKQTKLCFRKGEDSAEGNDENVGKAAGKSLTYSSKPEVFLLPLPKNAVISKAQNSPNKRPLQEHDEYVNKQTTLSNNETSSQSNPMLKNGRDQIVLIGMVDFCLKMHMLHPNVNAIWEVYGKLIKIVSGESKYESILILRSITDTGPVLQSIYIDVNNILEQFQPGSFLRAVGNFVTSNRLKTFKLELVDSAKYDVEHFARIHNVMSFVLLQNTISTTSIK